MLRQNGLEVPGNLEEFYTVCETLKGNGILPYGANKDFGLSVPAMCAGLGPVYQDPERGTGKTGGKRQDAYQHYMRDGFNFFRPWLIKDIWIWIKP